MNRRRKRHPLPYDAYWQYFRRVLLLISACAFVLATPRSLNAQEPPAAPVDPETAPAVRLKLQGEIAISDLVDYVSGRMGIHVMYGQPVGEKKVFVQAPDDIPVASLYDLLQSVLKTEDLAIADTEVDGWKRIVPAARIPEVATTVESDEALAAAGSAVPITQVFVLKNADPERIAEIFRPFLSADGSNCVALPQQRTLIVTDVAENIRRVRDLIEILDSAKPAATVKFLPAENVRAEELAEQLTALLTARGRALGRAESDATGVEVSYDSRTNQLILIGLPADIEQAETLLQALDTALPTTTETYALQFVSPSRLDQAAQAVIASRPRVLPYEARIEGNVLIVTTTVEVHRVIEGLHAQIDTRDAPAEESPIRFYKIRNVPVQDLLETLSGIEVGATTSGHRRRDSPPRWGTTNDAAVPGPNRPPVLADPGAAQPVVIPPAPPAFHGDPLEPDIPGVPRAPLPFDPFGTPETFPRDGEGDAGGLLPGPAQVSADLNSNSLIIVGSPEVQRAYATLIEALDQRRPQVMIEAKIVIIDTTDDFTLGVEISGGDRLGISRLFAFSSYGLSTVDPISGALQVIPGVGFNGTLVDPSTADIVVRALTRHTRARVLSAPRILVDDNAEGELASVAEVPFTSVNASNTVATTSFAGFAEAGTTITVTPTISDDDYLQLDYAVTLNSFTGPGSEGVPPPRQTNDIRSRVTVPDGYTVIVGGLTQKNASYEIDSIPFLENIPVLRELSSLQSTQDRQTSLFVFLRPVILREDKFKDLKYLSDVDIQRSATHPNFPSSEPISMK